MTVDDKGLEVAPLVFFGKVILNFSLKVLATSSQGFPDHTAWDCDKLWPIKNICMCLYLQLRLFHRKNDGEPLILGIHYFQTSPDETTVYVL